MKYFDQSSKNRPSPHWAKLAAASVLAAALVGCGGGSSGPAGPPGPTGPPATPGVDATAVVKLATLSADQFAATAFNAQVTSVTIASPPVVSFKVTDANGNPVVGLGSSSTGDGRGNTYAAGIKGYPNLAFSLAKLVPGVTTTVTTGGSTTSISTLSKWVSYIVTTVPTTTTAATATRPSTDSNGTLVDNGDGSYKYTFYRDITQVKAQVAAMTLTGANVAADLGDLTYDPTLIHRLTIQISGNVPGTGTNTADAVQVLSAVTLAKPNNTIYDFIPATGKAVALADPGQRLIVDKLSCNECHGKLGGNPGTESAGFHGGSRFDPKYCVVCHTDQRKYGQARAVSTNNAFPALTKTVSATGIVSYSPSTYVADGVTVGDFPVLIHRVHKGDLLIKQNYNYANMLLNENRFPQDIRNCTKCHDNTAPKAAPQADNFKNVPSRLACGACHDGIDFATGTGTTNAGQNTGHVGGPQVNDSLCAVCHTATNIATVYHVPVAPPNPANILLSGGTNNNTNAASIASNWNNLPAGAIKVSYDISSVSRNASKQPVITFRLLQNGVAVPLNDKTAKTEIWDNYMGSPSVYFVFAVPQDGIAAPADFNASASGYIKTIWNGTASGTGAATISAIDSAGYYTVTLTGVTVPDNAVMLTGGVGYTYGLQTTLPLTQTNLAAYPVVASTVTGSTSLKTGGLIVIAPDAQKVATGYTGRRAIVEDKRCNACHLELGVFTEESFHAGQRNDGTTCSWCHTPNRTSSGWSADSASFVHAIHAAAKRKDPFTWHAVTTSSSFADIGYPGILNACETCHLPGTYNFSASASASAVDNRLYRTVGQGNYPASGAIIPGWKLDATKTACIAGTATTGTALSAFSLSNYVTQSTATAITNYGIGFSFNAGLAASPACKPDGTFYTVAAGTSVAADATTLVISPITTACFSCHDGSQAVAHMKREGGSIYATPRGTALANPEQCLLCHGPGRVADIKTMHAK